MPSTIRLVGVTAAVALVCSISVALVVALAYRPPATLLANPAASTSGTIDHAILTTGDGTVSVKPDLATVSAGISSQQSSASAAQSDLARKAAQLITRVKALGVADRDLSASGYWVGPVYGPNGESITAYRASEQLVIKWHSVDSVGKTLDAIVQEGGATNVSVGFGLADPKPAEAQARAQAIADARSKAQAMASAAGVSVGQVIQVSDLSAATRPPYPLAYPERRPPTCLPRCPSARPTYRSPSRSISRSPDATRL